MADDRTTLDGLTFSVNPGDPAECFDFSDEDYEGLDGLFATVDGQTYPLHMCGDTNTGYNWNGCHHGRVDAATDGGTDHACSFVSTGETAIAQACVLPCSYVIDATFEPIVLVAEIDGQWYIVNVIDGANLLDPSRGVCEGHCCDVGRNDLQVVLGGCSPFAGETVRLRARLGTGLSWRGILEVGGRTLTIEAGCNDLSGTWSLSVVCSGGSGSLSYDIACGSSDSASNTGTGGDRVDGTFTLSGMTGCGDCSEITGVITSLETSSISECTNVEPTGEYAIAEACGLPFLEVGDDVIVALVPKSGGTGTDIGNGTGEGCLEPTTDELQQPQWQVVLACTGRDCEPCPPPPPPEDSICCDLEPDEIPTTLIGTMRVYSNVASCECEEDIIVSFTLVPGSVPARWIADSDFTCDTKDGTGSDEAASLMSLIGMEVSCGGLTGTDSDSDSASFSGSGSGPALFYLKRPGCSPVDPDSGVSVYTGEGTCDPVTMVFEGDFTACCGPVSGIEYYVRFRMELVGV